MNHDEKLKINQRMKNENSLICIQLMNIPKIIILNMDEIKLLSFILGHKSLRSSEEFTPAVAETQQKSF
jgi:hypothetical protein